MAEQPPLNPANDLLALQPMPEVATALRAQKPEIVRRWIEAVDALLPLADKLTTEQVRDTIPVMLEYLADALHSSNPGQTRELEALSTKHGVARFHQSSNVSDLLIEYRLFRRITTEQVAVALGGLSLPQMLALDMGIDIVFQQGIVAFTDHLREQIEAASAAEGRYLAFLSHDLRNHLNHVTLVLQLHAHRLRDHPGFADDARELDEVRQSIFHTIEGMDRLLQIERLRHDTLTPRRESFDLSALVRNLLERFGREARDKGLSLSCDVPAGFGVSTDPDLIVLVLQNLVGNAVKFCDSGAVRVTAERAADAGWSVAVRDEGPGISREVQDRLFKVFSRGETHGKSGMGLGLAIASQAAKRLGGQLSIESQPGAGSTFRLTMPQLVG